MVSTWSFHDLGTAEGATPVVGLMLKAPRRPSEFPRAWLDEIPILYFAVIPVIYVQVSGCIHEHKLPPTQL